MKAYTIYRKSLGTKVTQTDRYEFAERYCYLKDYRKQVEDFFFDDTCPHDTAFAICKHKDCKEYN